MKTEFIFSPHHRSERGSVVILMLALIGLMSAVAIANTRSLHRLRRQIDAIDERQKQFWNNPTNRTPAAPVSISHETK
jgi:hypothetical protein